MRYLIPTVAAVLVVGGGIAIAQPEDDGTLMQACSHDRTGMLRLVDGPDDCRPSETPVSWNAVGPQGPIGPAGPQGEPGADGEDGADGAPGEPGVDGNLALAGQVCPEGTRVAGFDADGDLICGACVIPELCVPEPEICNGVDDDCNDVVDDDLGDPPPCDLTEGVCAGATATCAGVDGWDCDYAALPGYEVTETLCDEADNDCDGLIDEHVDFATDGTNCGSCGNDCAAGLGGHDVTECVDAACQYSCVGTFRDCDGDLGSGTGTGCETDIADSPDNCGGCGIQCDLPNADSGCEQGECVVETCHFTRGDPSSSWADCDGDDANGCERSFDYPTGAGSDWSNPIDLGSGRGDGAFEHTIATESDHHSVWYRVEITEEDFSVIGDLDLRATIDLDFAPPIVYWLYVYDEAFGLLGSSNSSPIVVDREDTIGSDDFVLHIEVRYFNGQSCVPWTLTVTGGPGS